MQANEATTFEETNVIYNPGKQSPDVIIERWWSPIYISSLSLCVVNDCIVLICQQQFYVDIYLTIKWILKDLLLQTT